MEPVILGIDPGEKYSGVVVLGITTGSVVASDAKMDNYAVLKMLRETDAYAVIEMIESFGMAVGKETFKTCVWIGRMLEAHGEKNTVLVGRKEIKLYLCGTVRATDANIRIALIDKFGGQEKAIGLKKTPGPLYRVKSHAWSALSLAMYHYEKSNPT